MNRALDMTIASHSQLSLTPALPMIASPTPIMLLISSLEHGGAERQVVELANHLDPAEFQTTVTSLSEHVPLAESLREKQDRLCVIPRTKRLDGSALRGLCRLLRARRIKILHTFLFDAEVLGRLAAKWTGVPVVIASERNTDYRRPLWQEMFLRCTRSWFDCMVANSQAGKDFNIRTMGIRPERIRVVRNGVDVLHFSPRTGLTVRRDLGIPALAPVVGMIASFKEQKRHGDFFAMAKLVVARFPECRFLCAGEPLRDNLQGSADYHAKIRAFVQENGLTDRVYFLGKRDDMPDIYNSCDATVLPSSREGTPNVLLESMACGVPVVASDVSDNAQIVPGGDMGFIVPLGDVRQMADRVCHLLMDSARRKERGRCAREWVVREFSSAALARNTAAVYRDCLRNRGLPTA